MKKIPLTFVPSPTITWWHTTFCLPHDKVKWKCIKPEDWIKGVERKASTHIAQVYVRTSSGKIMEKKQWEAEGGVPTPFSLPHFKKEFPGKVKVEKASQAQKERLAWMHKKEKYNANIISRAICSFLSPLLLLVFFLLSSKTEPTALAQVQPLVLYRYYYYSFLLTLTYISHHHDHYHIQTVCVFSLVCKIQSKQLELKT